MPGLEEAFQRIGEALERQLPLTHAPGVALAVTDGDETLGAAVRGLANVDRGTPVTPTTRFQIASMSKSFAGLVAVQEAVAGRLDLAASINDVIAWLELPEPFGPVTVHHLLTHTAGLASGSDLAPWGIADVVQLRNEPPVWAPGTRAHYSNAGWKLVGMALEHVTGTPIAPLLTERVLGPLGMTDSEAWLHDVQRTDAATGYMPVRTDRPAHLEQPLGPGIWQTSVTADGSIVSTVVDMCAYLRAVLARGAPLVDDDGFARWVGPHEDAEDAGERYGYGWVVHEVDGHRTIRHTGTNIGFNGLMAVRPDQGLGLVVLLNGWGERTAVARYAFDVVAAAIGGEPLPEVPAIAAADEVADADTYEGTFVGHGRRVVLRREGTGVLLEAGPVGVRLEHLGDLLIAPHPSLELYPLITERDASGQVVALGHGPSRYVRDGHEPAAVDDPSRHTEPLNAWSTIEGAYRGESPWVPLVRVYARGGRLFALYPVYGEEEELYPLDDGSFALTTSDGPERLRFDQVVDGRAQRLTHSGAAWFRSFES